MSLVHDSLSERASLVVDWLCALHRLAACIPVIAPVAELLDLGLVLLALRLGKRLDLRKKVIFVLRLQISLHLHRE